jgi:hypothetical protein
MSASNDVSRKRGPNLRARLFSVATLCGVVTLMGFAGDGIYRIATDEFVAPCALSPDSDLVIQSKLSMAQLVAEQFRVTTRREELDVSIEAADKAIAELEELKGSASRGLEFTTALTAKQAVAGTSDLRALAKQRTDLNSMVAAQEAIVVQTKRDLDVGLGAKADYSREVQALNQMKLALIENDRSRFVSELAMSQVNLTEQAMRKSGMPHVATPEMLMLQDQVVRVSTELLKLRAERRSAVAEKVHLDEEGRMITQLINQLAERPTFTAATSSITVAFVPYSQMDGVASGAPIYDCVWGLFRCKAVGHVTKLLPGEVILPDPWGTPTRGQYATMNLEDPTAAKSRTLRVRPHAAAVAASTKTFEGRFATAK